MTGGAQADEEPGFSISDACIAGVRFIGAHPSPPHPPKRTLRLLEAMR